jgi:hypothetical protein
MLVLPASRRAHQGKVFEKLVKYQFDRLELEDNPNHVIDYDPQALLQDAVDKFGEAEVKLMLREALRNALNSTVHMLDDWDSNPTAVVHTGESLNDVVEITGKKSNADLVYYTEPVSGQTAFSFIGSSVKHSIADTDPKAQSFSIRHIARFFEVYANHTNLGGEFIELGKIYLQRMIWAVKPWDDQLKELFFEPWVTRKEGRHKTRVTTCAYKDGILTQPAISWLRDSKTEPWHRAVFDAISKHNLEMKRALTRTLVQAFNDANFTREQKAELLCVVTNTLPSESVLPKFTIYTNRGKPDIVYSEQVLISKYVNRGGDLDFHLNPNATLGTASIKFGPGRLSFDNRPTHTANVLSGAMNYNIRKGAIKELA